MLPEEDVAGSEELIDEDLWTLEFDGSCALFGSREGALIFPSSKIIPKFFKLDFENTSNTTEYEALLLGIEEAKKKWGKILKEKGDIELVFKKV